MLLPLICLPALTLVLPAPQTSKTVSRSEAEAQLVEAFDEEMPLPSPKVAARDQAALRWLRSAIQETDPKNPFPKNTSFSREADRLLRLFAAPPETWASHLRELPLKLTGTRMALWRWGRLQVRAGLMNKATRWAWEDLLLQGGHPRLRGLAQRHALCWALAEADETRFSVLKQKYSPESSTPFSNFQTLFGWLGGTTAPFRLWKFPAFDYQDLRLDQLEVTRIWICPADEKPPHLSPGTAWIIPSKVGNTIRNAARPSLIDLAEATELLPRLKAANLEPWLAAHRQEWEDTGLMFFPILIELDAAKQISRIRMGDAAPLAP